MSESDNVIMRHIRAAFSLLEYFSDPSAPSKGDFPLEPTERSLDAHREIARGHPTGAFELPYIDNDK